MDHVKRKLSELRCIENEYLEFFAKVEREGVFNRFSDAQLPSMYSHNCWILREPLDDAMLYTEIEKLLLNAEEQGNTCLFIVLHPNQTFRINEKFSAIFKHFSLQYMTMPLGRYQPGKYNSKSDVHKATTPSLLQDAIICDIAASLAEDEETVGYGFAYQRAMRKRPLFEQCGERLSQYVAYLEGVPVGKCEVSVHGKILRIESFSVITEYQRKGIGSSLLSKIVDDAKKLGVMEMTVVTDPDDTSKKMYEKFGFEMIGVEHHLLWIKEKKSGI